MSNEALVQKVADAVEVALGDDGHSVVYKNRAVRDAIRAALSAPEAEAVAFDGALYEKAYRSGYRAALSAASAKCRHIGEALDNGGNTYVRYEDAIKCAAAVSALRIPGIEAPSHSERVAVPEGFVPVRFVGVSPMALMDGACLPMLRDSWRFAFWEQDERLCFGRRDDGPLVAYDAVDSKQAPPECMACEDGWICHGGKGCKCPAEAAKRLHREAVRVAAVAAIRAATGCPDLIGRDGTALSELLMGELDGMLYAAPSAPAVKESLTTAPAVPVGDGWVKVPKVATPEIVAELENMLTRCHTVEESWADLLRAASPAATKEG